MMAGPLMGIEQCRLSSNGQRQLIIITNVDHFNNVIFEDCCSTKFKSGTDKSNMLFSYMQLNYFR